MSVGESLTSTWQWNSIFGREVSKTNKSTKERERMDKTGNAGLEIDPHSPLRRRLCPEIHALVSFDIIKRRQGERERVVPSQPPVYSLWWIICFPVFQKNNEGRRLCDITSRHSDALILSWGRPSGHRCRLLWFVNKSTEKKRCTCGLTQLAADDVVTASQPAVVFIGFAVRRIAIGKKHAISVPASSLLRKVSNIQYCCLYNNGDLAVQSVGDRRNRRRAHFRTGSSLEKKNDNGSWINMLLLLLICSSQLALRHFSHWLWSFYFYEFLSKILMASSLRLGSLSFLDFRLEVTKFNCCIY